jgi:hypothetical protein
MLNGAMTRAACLATPLRDKLHEKLHRVTGPYSFERVQRKIWHAYISVKITLENTEKNNVRNEVNAHKDNVGYLWKIINRSIPTKERTTQVYSKPTEQIANDFNQYFVSVGKQAANVVAQLAKDNNIDVTAVSDLPKFLGSPFKFSPVSCMEVQRIIKAMPSNKSSGPDKVSMRVIKDSLPVILGPLTDIINTFLATSTFPDYWKEAEVIHY